jgi:hypothetical protein
MAARSNCSAYRGPRRASGWNCLPCARLYPTKNCSSRGIEPLGKSLRMVRPFSDIESVPIRCRSAWNGAEIAGEMQAQRHDAAELEQPQPRIVFVLVAAALRRIDDDVYEASLAPRRKAHSPVEGADGRPDRLHTISSPPSSRSAPSYRRRSLSFSKALIAPAIEFKVSSFYEGRPRGSCGSNT